MMNENECVVVIPVYKSLGVNDIIALKQAVEMTPGAAKAFIMPNSLQIDDSLSDFPDFIIKRFDNRFFKSKMSYNELMLDLDFYKCFSDYKYMFIHQTDAYLFKPELKYWCDKDYDYIGAPWLRPSKMKKAVVYKKFIKMFPGVLSHKLRNRIKHYNNVGNGGLSLRKIDTFIKILESKDNKPVIDFYLKEQLSKGTLYNEDVFWGIEGPVLYEKFSKPDWREACFFSLENYPSFAFNNVMDRQLPFGCHAPLVHEPDFWKSYISFVD